MHNAILLAKLREMTELEQRLSSHIRELVRNQRAGCEEHGFFCHDWMRPFEEASDTDEYGRTRPDKPDDPRCWGLVCAMCGRKDRTCSYRAYEDAVKNAGLDKLSYDERMKKLQQYYFAWHTELLTSKENTGGN